jgi:RNA polymerase sigma-70 factor (ECF subfamily)
VGESAEEKSWLEAARRQEPWALERFYETYRPLVFRLCVRVAGRIDDAEDATQAVFVNAFRQLPRFRGRSSLKTWVYRIALNEVVQQRRRRREVSLPEGERGGVPDGAAEVIENVVVRDALARMSPEHRAVLILRFWEGLSGPELAEVLGISLPAVKMRMHRARKEFRKQYEEQS